MAPQCETPNQYRVPQGFRSQPRAGNLAPKGLQAGMYSQQNTQFHKKPRNTILLWKIVAHQSNFPTRMRTISYPTVCTMGRKAAPSPKDFNSMETKEEEMLEKPHSPSASSRGSGSFAQDGAQNTSCPTRHGCSGSSAAVSAGEIPPNSH